MKLFASFLISFLLVARANGQQSITPAADASLVKLLQFEASSNNNKILLSWMIGVNEYADKFEVERSTDGKTYVMVALVFGTDKNDNDHYMFYEKAAEKRAMYRLKIFDKSKGVLYSNSVVAENNNTPVR